MKHKIVFRKKAKKKLPASEGREPKEYRKMNRAKQFL